MISAIYTISLVILAVAAFMMQDEEEGTCPDAIRSA